MKIAIFYKVHNGGEVMKKPTALRAGDIIGITAPSGFASEATVLQAKAVLEAWGFGVVLGKSCFSKRGYLAGEDLIRAEDLNFMFQNSSIKGIICLRGGFGVTRILNYIDYEIIKDNPKLLVGFSDITALHIALNQKSNLITLHGPMAVSISRGLDSFTQESLIKALTQPIAIGKLKNPEGIMIDTIVEGEARGRIIGGNLTMICSTLGTSYEIDTKGKLLLIEEIGEEPYRIDRMLTQLLLAGKLQEAAGFLIGDFNGCSPKNIKESLTLQEIFREIINPLKKPTIANLKIGHCSPNITLPLGAEAYINAEEGLLTIKESATRP